MVPSIGRMIPFHKQAYGLVGLPEKIQRPGAHSNGHSVEENKRRKHSLYIYIIT